MASPTINNGKVLQLQRHMNVRSRYHTSSTALYGGRYAATVEFSREIASKKDAGRGGGVFMGKLQV